MNASIAGMVPVIVGDRQASLAPVDAVVTDAETPLTALEVRQDIDIAPAAVAALRPVVEILALAAVVDHAVDGARPTQSAALGRRDAAAVDARHRVRSGTARYRSD